MTCVALPCGITLGQVGFGFDCIDATCPNRPYLDSQVAGNYRPLDPNVDLYWFKVAQNYEPLALQVVVLKGPYS